MEKALDGNLEILLSKLNDAQREAVIAPDGPLLIFAGAGSGKTSVLTRRIVNLLLTERAEASQICALTFTNKAASEMRGRVSEILGEEPRGMYIGTFHALGVRMLKQWDYAARLGRSGLFSIYGEMDQMAAVADAVSKVGLDLDALGLKVGDVIERISRFKDEMVSVEEALKMAEGTQEIGIAKAYESYQALLLAADAVDFDDLILLPVRLLKENPDVLDYFQRRWSHFLVDEYQDTSRAQFELVSLLSSKSRNLTVVGDDDQCLARGTRVLMSDGSDKNIEEVVPGDMVGIPGLSGEIFSALVERTFRGLAPYLLSIETASGKTLSSTLEHTHLVSEEAGVLADSPTVRSVEKPEGRRRVLRMDTDGGRLLLIPAVELKPGAKLVDSNGRAEEIVRIHLTVGKVAVYDLDVSSFHRFLANGILTHNSIYGWRGADVRNLTSFQELYPDAKIVKLEQNYRSHQGILETAHAVILNNEGRVDKKLWSERLEGPLPLVQEVLDEEDESQFVAERIATLRAEEGIPYKEMVVLYRTNAQSRAIEDSLIRKGIPYQIVRQTRFYDRDEIRNVLSYLSLFRNPRDIEAFKRTVKRMEKGVGEVSIERAIAEADRTGMSILETLKSPALLGSVTRRARVGLERYSRTMEELQEVSERESLQQLIGEIMEKTGYREALEKAGTKKSEAKLANLEELRGLSAEYDLDLPPGGLDRFLVNARLITQFDEATDKEGGVTLITAHLSKGLEYGAVFMIGLEEGIFPHRGSMDEEGIKEERRLAYVGITRAKTLLFVTFCRNRHLYGHKESFDPSRFLTEMGNTVEWKGLSRKFRGKELNRPSTYVRELD